MARHRLAVALLLSGDAAVLVDAVRLALGDPDIGRVPSHLTLVTPTNVRDDEVASVLSALRVAAARTPPFDVWLGPVTTFAPVTGTIHLAVSHDEAIQRLGDLRAAARVGVLDRPQTHPFVPHVTLVAQAPLHRIHGAAHALAPMEPLWRVERITVLREERGEDRVRRWRPWADADLDGVRMGGGGVLPLQLTTSTLVDPQAQRLVDRELPIGPQLVVTARADGVDVVGVAFGVPRTSDVPGLPGFSGTAGGEPWIRLAPGARALGVHDHLAAEWHRRSAL